MNGYIAYGVNNFIAYLIYYIYLYIRQIRHVPRQIRHIPHQIRHIPLCCLKLIAICLKILE